jgi:hypothetical protein
MSSSGASGVAPSFAALPVNLRALLFGNPVSKMAGLQAISVGPTMPFLASPTALVMAPYVQPSAPAPAPYVQPYVERVRFSWWVWIIIQLISIPLSLVAKLELSL